jgi:hypothetical protein
MIAQDYAVSREVQDSLPTIIDLLQEVDQTFRPVPHRSGAAASSAFQNASGYRVEFLTSNLGSDNYTDQPSKMPFIGGASVDPLRFLYFLIRDFVRTVLVYKAGVSVTAPDSARYAVHKMIVATRRRNYGMSAIKRDKDIRQAAILFETLYETRRASDFTIGFDEAWARGSAWQETLNEPTMSMISKDAHEMLNQILPQGYQELGKKQPENLQQRITNEPLSRR